MTVNRMKPVTDETFSFDQAKEAFSYMASGAHFGKVAIVIGQPHNAVRFLALSYRRLNNQPIRMNLGHGRARQLPCRERPSKLNLQTRYPARPISGPP